MTATSRSNVNISIEKSGQSKDSEISRLFDSIPFTDRLIWLFFIFNSVGLITLIQFLFLT